MRHALRAGGVVAAAVAGGWLPGPVLAHSFGQVYNLPVPVWLYLYGAAAALALSFLVIGYFVTVGRVAVASRTLDLGASALARAGRRLAVIPVLRAVAVAGLLLCIVTGLFGTPNPYGNFNMTFFWIVFALGFTYLTALAGDLYAAINPWRTLADGIEGLFRGYARGRFRYPERLGHWPALVLYLAFIWLELFGGVAPFSLAVVLAGYTGLNLTGVWLVGASAWFRYCEFFGLFFRLIARMAPVDYLPRRDDPDGRGRLRLRPPFVGVLQARAPDLSVLVFVLFMLSSTAFDGLHETVVWRKLFFVDLYHWGLREWVGANPFAAYPQMSRLFGWWQTFWLLASPFLYLAVYLGFIALTKWAGRSELTVAELARRFTLPLLPIALVYHVTHYYTLIQTQGVKIVTLASDPFGRGWDLFGTGDWLQRTIIPDAGTVWHVQVGLIVLGHIVSVYLAHLEALRTFPDHRRATLSQLPMLGLMVLFTTVGLWILSQPIQG